MQDGLKCTRDKARQRRHANKRKGCLRSNRAARAGGARRGTRYKAADGCVPTRSFCCLTDRCVCTRIINNNNNNNGLLDAEDLRADEGRNLREGDHNEDAEEEDDDGSRRQQQQQHASSLRMRRRVFDLPGQIRRIQYDGGQVLFEAHGAAHGKEIRVGFGVRQRPRRPRTSRRVEVLEEEDAYVPRHPRRQQGRRRFLRRLQAAGGQIRPVGAHEREERARVLRSHSDPVGKTVGRGEPLQPRHRGAIPGGHEQRPERQESRPQGPLFSPLHLPGRR